MPPNLFQSITISDATAKLPRRPDYAAELDQFLAGDMWQSAAAWIGELPVDQNALAAMARGIVSENILDELLFRYVAAVIGKEPRWSLVYRDGRERTDTDEASVIEQALTGWWDKLNLVSVLQRAAWHKGAEGRGPLYLLIPPGLREEDGTIPRQVTLAEALEYLYVDARSPSSAGVAFDRTSRLPIGIVTDECDGKQTVDVTYRDSNGMTVLRVLTGEDGQDGMTVDLGGHLFVHDRPCDPLITKQLVQMQKAITLTLSQLMRNINLAGHRQVDYINAEPPGEWVVTTADDPLAQSFPGGVYKKFVPGTIYSGPGVRNFIQGNDIYNERGEKIGVTNPNVSTVDPVDVAHFERTYAIFRASAHVQAHQAHVLMDSDAPASGISREQARADFETALGPLKTALDEAGRWMLEAALALAAHLMGRPGMFAELRAEFACVINTGPLTAAEQQEIRANVEAGLLSRETAMSQLGLDDVQAEQQRIDGERQATSPAPLVVPGQGATGSRNEGGNNADTNTIQE